MLTVVATHNVSIVGEGGATIRMWKQDYRNWTEYMKGEWRMGIKLGHEINNESAFKLCEDMAVRGESREFSESVVERMCNLPLVFARIYTQQSSVKQGCGSRTAAATALSSPTASVFTSLT